MCISFVDINHLQQQRQLQLIRRTCNWKDALKPNTNNTAAMYVNIITEIRIQGYSDPYARHPSAPPQLSVNNLRLLVHVFHTENDNDGAIMFCRSFNINQNQYLHRLQLSILCLRAPEMQINTLSFHTVYLHLAACSPSLRTFFDQECDFLDIFSYSVFSPHQQIWL